MIQVVMVLNFERSNVRNLFIRHRRAEVHTNDTHNNGTPYQQKYLYIKYGLRIISQPLNFIYVSEKAHPSSYPLLRGRRTNQETYFRIYNSTKYNLV